MGKAKRKNQHVIPHAGGWAVKGEGNTRVTAKYDTQHEAINAGREIARNQKVSLFIHRRNGYIREGESIGSDPRPSRGRSTGSYREILFPTSASITGDKAIKEAVFEVVQTSRGSSRNSSRDESRG